MLSMLPLYVPLKLSKIRKRGDISYLMVCVTRTNTPKLTHGADIFVCVRKSIRKTSKLVIPLAEAIVLDLSGVYRRLVGGGTVIFLKIYVMGNR
jgi:hypothetical protein